MNPDMLFMFPVMIGFLEWLLPVIFGGGKLLIDLFSGPTEQERMTADLARQQAAQGRRMERFGYDVGVKPFYEFGEPSREAFFGQIQERAAAGGGPAAHLMRQMSQQLLGDDYQLPELRGVELRRGTVPRSLQPVSREDAVAAYHRAFVAAIEANAILRAVMDRHHPNWRAQGHEWLHNTVGRRMGFPTIDQWLAQQGDVFRG